MVEVDGRLYEADDDDGGNEIGHFHRKSDAQVVSCTVNARAVDKQIEGCADGSQEGRHSERPRQT